jgi:demethylmenaquinone methyltransferase/2-methoxy-6-polyprenyl-1,4-benzoquinol methylase
MFGGIAPFYDRLNHGFSAWMDRAWRRRLAAGLVKDLRPCPRVLDIATGTGDVAAAIMRRSPDCRLIGLDFTRPMLKLADRKWGSGACRWIEGDALRLPFADGVFDACCVAFGLRNMADRRGALVEMERVLRPGGRVGILEFSRPPGRWTGAIYDFYSLKVMPRLGQMLTGSTAYRYLGESVRAFPNPDELAGWMAEAGFEKVTYRRRTTGVVCFHFGIKR